MRAVENGTMALPGNIKHRRCGFVLPSPNAVSICTSPLFISSVRKVLNKEPLFSSELHASYDKENRFRSVVRTSTVQMETP
jgi:hypothetical protein